MAEAGIDLEDFSPVKIEDILGRITARYLFILCDGSEKDCPITFLGAIHKVCWPFADPAAHPGDEEEKLQKFREIRDQIEARVQQWLQEDADSTMEAWEAVRR